jgi:hypothetical protein
MILLFQYILFGLLIVFFVGIIKGGIKTFGIYGRTKNALAFFTALCALLILTMSSAPTSVDDKGYGVVTVETEYFQKGKQAYEAQDYDSAETYFNKVPSGDLNYWKARDKLKEIQSIKLNAALDRARKKLEKKDFAGARSEVEEALSIDKYSREAENLALQIDDQEKIAIDQQTNESIAKSIADAMKKLQKNDFQGALADLKVAAQFNPNHAEVKQLEALIAKQEKNYLEQKKQEEIRTYKAESRTYTYEYFVENIKTLTGKKIKLSGKLSQIGNTHHEMFALLKVSGSERNMVQINYPMDYLFEENEQVTVWGEVQGMQFFRLKSGDQIEIPLIAVKYME